MEWKTRARPLLLILLVSGGCQESTPVGPGLPGDVIALEIKGRKLAVEVACDDPSRQTGLMHRQRLGEDRGMLFIFPDDRQLGFWMKNTSIPLSIAFLDDRGTILQIEDMRPHDETSTRALQKGRYAVEVNRGWFERQGIKVGDAFADFGERTRGFRVH